MGLVGWERRGEEERELRGRKKRGEEEIELKFYPLTLATLTVEVVQS